MFSKNVLIALPFICAFSLNAAPVHNHAKDGLWGKMFMLIKMQPDLVNELEEGTNDSVLDIALRSEATGVVQTLLSLGALPGVMLEMGEAPAEPLTDESFHEIVDKMLEIFREGQAHDVTEGDASSDEWPHEMQAHEVATPYTERDQPKPRATYDIEEDNELDVSRILNFDSLPH